MRVERFTALEMAKAGRAKEPQSNAVTATHLAPAKKRLIFGKSRAAGESQLGRGGD
jgi:hypothetical protein